MTKRVALRLTSSASRPERGMVFQKLYGELGIALTRLIEIKTGFVALCYTEKDVDTLVGEEARRILNAIGLDPRVPPEITAQRSVICRQIDPYVGGHTAAEIKDEIMRLQEWCNIKEIIKFSNYTHIFKIVFSDTTMASKALEQGLVCFNVRISPAQIQKEVFTNLLICFKCYEMESHTTADCPNSSRVVCSECGSQGHIWRDCTSENKKCLNCGGGHRTMAMACPERKRLIKEKQEGAKKKEAEKEMKSYAKVAEIFKEDQRQNNIRIQIDNTTPLHISTCILHAHFINIARPGTFNEEVNKMLRKNGFEELVFPENPPSEDILRITNLLPSRPQQADPEPMEEERSPGTEMAQPKSLREEKWSRRMERQGEMDIGSELGSRESLSSVTGAFGGSSEQQKEVKSKPRRSREGKQPKDTATTARPTYYDAREFNLNIYIPETLKEEPRDPQGILEGIKQKKFKWSYDADVEETRVEERLFRGLVRIPTQSVVIVPDDVFNKKRSGKTKSPPKGARVKTLNK